MHAKKLLTEVLLLLALLALLPASAHAQDLSLDINIVDTQLQRGEPLVVGFVVTNQTNLQASQYRVGFYASTDATLNGGDLLLGTFESEGPIPAQSFRENTISLDTCDLAAGSWRILGRVEDVVPSDSNPLNNTAIAPPTVRLAANPLACGDNDSTSLINAGLNDAWFDPEQSGQGLLLTVFPQGGLLFLAWFTFDLELPGPEATAILGDPGQRWLTASGSWTGNRAELTVTNTSGGIFDRAEPPVSNDSDYGSMIVEVLDCNSAMVSYELAGVSGSFPVERVARDNIVLCEALAQQAGEP